MKLERAFVIYRGHVQGVGFRYTCRSLAHGFSITGQVKNLEDGRVEMIVEGERPEIEDFLKEYNKDKRYTYIVSYEQGLFYYKDSSYNVTADVIKGLNERYKVKKD